MRGVHSATGVYFDSIVYRVVIMQQLIWLHFVTSQVMMWINCT